MLPMDPVSCETGIRSGRPRRARDGMSRTRARLICSVVRWQKASQPNVGTVDLCCAPSALARPESPGGEARSLSKNSFTGTRRSHGAR